MVKKMRYCGIRIGLVEDRPRNWRIFTEAFLLFGWDWELYFFERDFFAI
jgi:hypothetical protein